LSCHFHGPRKLGHRNPLAVAPRRVGGSGAAVGLFAQMGPVACCLTLPGSTCQLNVQSVPSRPSVMSLSWSRGPFSILSAFLPQPSALSVESSICFCALLCLFVAILYHLSLCSLRLCGRILFIPDTRHHILHSRTRTRTRTIHTPTLPYPHTPTQAVPHPLSSISSPEP